MESLQLEDDWLQNEEQMEKDESFLYNYTVRSTSFMRIFPFLFSHSYSLKRTTGDTVIN
jgi:hypothetical protein